MIFFWLLLGVSLPTASGWFLCRIVEYRSPVLFRWERIALGFLLGITLTMFISFLANVLLGMPFSRFGFLSVQITLTTVLGGGWFLMPREPMSVSAIAPSPPLPKWARGLLIICGLWILVKIIAGLVLLTATPVYFDDVFNNWNMRGKISFVTEELALDAATEEAISSGGVNSYPPTVPLLKTWIAKLAGRWEEGLVNTPHILWYLSAAVLLWAALRRRTDQVTALLGTLMLLSIPLFLMHGISPYADAFLSAHVFAAVAMLFAAVTARESMERNAFFRLGAASAGLLAFTKNEALLLHLPPLLLILCIALIVLFSRGTMTRRGIMRTLLFYGVSILAVAGPWILFKWLHGLPFGNAKGIPGFVAFWQPGVLYAMNYGLFFEGNWILFFPLLILGMALAWKRLFRLPHILPLSFFLIVFLGQLPIYMFTGLATEVLRQTGYARGMIHILPVGILALTLLYRDILMKTKT